jgi:hypothetical protein
LPKVTKVPKIKKQVTEDMRQWTEWQNLNPRTQLFHLYITSAFLLFGLSFPILGTLDILGISHLFQDSGFHHA